ncbi:MAG TPA: 16S rRNA (guanine(527)-N(7))-methyltransferase RsmG [Candidatus Binatia bacterium]|jgi:16S rRNA (guanine527-N7)-methyltransferase|nr:16S rRNA (guanine(527)-N(7))-methyltransferase RsmG [Candidatus Binatia bacterium]
MLNQSQTYLLTEGARRLGLELADTHLACFSLYVEEIARWSRVTNLISQIDPEIIIRKHILDSLAVSPLIPADIRLLDLGSGAGFPGLVLAILQSSRAVVLLEARRKRVSFLKETVRRVKITNVKVYEGRAETLAKEDSLRTSFAVVISRATWSLKEFLTLAHPFIADRGIALAMKGPRGEPELNDLADFPQTLGFCWQGLCEYTLPFGAERRQTIIFAKQCLT